MTVIGIILNRINTSIIAFNWNEPERYYPLWTEIAITIGVITMGIIAFRWIINRMAILYDHPKYSSERYPALPE
jgi:Ni/Fe-hydrogenase subunit HybB-like protein